MQAQQQSSASASGAGDFPALQPGLSALPASSPVCQRLSVFGCVMCACVKCKSRIKNSFICVLIEQQSEAHVCHAVPVTSSTP